MYRLVCFAAIYISAAAAYSVQDVPSPKMTYVGEFNGHKYYSEPGPFLWYDGSLFCQNNGMSLVAIETQAEHTFLLQALSGAVRYYWTSGRERNYNRIESYEWFNNGLPVTNLGGATMTTSCLAFYSGGQGPWLFVDCFTSRYPILCEESPDKSNINTSDPNHFVKPIIPAP